MHEGKRHRLMTKGWRIGDAREFLSLTEQESAYIDLRLKLAEGLKAKRIEHRMTQSELAQAIRSSQSRVAKMEAGDPTVSLDLLVRSLLTLGASARELARLIVSSSHRR